LVRANHAFQTSEFAIHRQKIEICPSAEPKAFALDLLLKRSGSQSSSDARVHTAYVSLSLQLNESVLLRISNKFQLC
jgi:hypothetical protein